MESTPIHAGETSGELHDRLAPFGAPVMLNVVNLIEKGKATPIPQDDSLVSRAPQIRKEQGEIDWSQTSKQIENHIRAMQPWPKPFTFLPVSEKENVAGKENERIIINQVKQCETVNTSEETGVISVSPDGILSVRTGDGAVEIVEIQPAGKRKMTGIELANGRPGIAKKQFVQKKSD